MQVTLCVARSTWTQRTAAVTPRHSWVKATMVPEGLSSLWKVSSQTPPTCTFPVTLAHVPYPQQVLVAHTHLLVDVGIDPLLAFQPLLSHPTQLLFRALVPLQQGAVCVLIARVMCRGSQPRERRISAKERGPKALGQRPEVCLFVTSSPNVTRGTPPHTTHGCREGSANTYARYLRTESGIKEKLKQVRIQKKKSQW